MYSRSVISVRSLGNSDTIVLIPNPLTPCKLSELSPTNALTIL